MMLRHSRHGSHWMAAAKAVLLLLLAMQAQHAAVAAPAWAAGAGGRGLNRRTLLETDASTTASSSTSSSTWTESVAADAEQSDWAAKSERKMLAVQQSDPKMPLTDKQREVIFPSPPVGNCSVHMAARPSAPLPHFRWLHIPKAGSSLATTLYHYACPLLPRDALPQFPVPGMTGRVVKYFENRFPFYKYCNTQDISWNGPRAGHHPLKSDDTVPMLVTMVRDPRRRLVSAYNYHMHAAGMAIKDRARMRQTVTSLKEYVNFPGIRGCQVKMMNGYPCNKPVEVTEEMTQYAINRIRQAAFVGDTDEWDSSICLFHAMFGGEVNPHSFQNVRPTTAKNYDRTSSDMLLSPEDDPHDWEFYLAAKAVMRRNQELYGMPMYHAPVVEEQ